MAYDTIPCRTCDKELITTEEARLYKGKCTTCRAIKHKRKKKKNFHRLLTISLTKEQMEILELWAKDKTAGNVSLLVRQLLFSGQDKV